MNSGFVDLLHSRRTLLADGATGSNLFAVGLQAGDAPELWNDLYPERIGAQYRNFIAAGSDIILTNTFGGSRYRLKMHNAEHRVEELNIKAAQLARAEVSAAGRTVIIGGSIGPTGEMIAPLGPLSHREAVDAFAEQAQALKDGGVDVLWIETMFSREEVIAATEGAGRAGLPMVVTFSVDTNGRTMMGLSPADIVQLTLKLEYRPLAIGANCGTGAPDLVAALINMQRELARCGEQIILIAKANCGIPEYVDGGIVYSGTEQIMFDYARLSMDAGARIIGGCCGTTPGHVAAMRRAVDAHAPGGMPELADIEARLGQVSAGASTQIKGDLNIPTRAGRRRRRRE